LNAITNVIRAINDLVSKIVMAIGMAIIAFAVLAMAGGAVTRYYTGMGYDWVMDLPPIMMPWLVFLLCGVLFRSGAHITVDFLPRYLTVRGQRILQLFVHLVVLAATIVFLIAGIEAVALFRMLGQVMEIEFDLPMWYVYLSFPVGFAILASFTVELVLDDVAALKNQDRVKAHGGSQ
jgi:TRAP-type C4-dicarboxylate transport system permease small subunit|tara:strand:+ start:282 stop:815 length:534 start_codon:yes stop_codon:yes gene_type:complete